MANKGDFLSVQLEEAEERAVRAKDNLASTPVVTKTEPEPEAERAQEPSTPSHTPVSTTSVPDVEKPSDSRSTGSAGSKRTRKDWRTVKRRRRTHSLTFTDDEWNEMAEAAQRHSTDVSKMIVMLWEKKGRKLFG